MSQQKLAQSEGENVDILKPWSYMGGGEGGEVEGEAEVKGKRKGRRRSRGTKNFFRELTVYEVCC